MRRLQGERPALRAVERLDASARADTWLEDLSEAYRTGVVHRRALVLYRSIPAQHQGGAAVRQLRDTLAA